jgi:hypothetical protein
MSMTPGRGVVVVIVAVMPAASGPVLVLVFAAVCVAVMRVGVVRVRMGRVTMFGMIVMGVTVLSM